MEKLKEMSIFSLQKKRFKVGMTAVFKYLKVCPKEKEKHLFSTSAEMMS